MDLSSNYASGARTWNVPKIKNLRSNNTDVAAANVYWETVYSDDDFLPADNGGYDFIGTNTDRAPILVPFGVCSKTTHAFIGGAITDLCDFYLGPTNLGAVFEEVEIGTDTYVTIPLNSGGGTNIKRLYIPKG